MSSFYVYLPSSVDTTGGYVNRHSHYTVPLPKHIQLPGEWECALVEFHHVNSVTNLKDVYIKFIPEAHSELKIDLSGYNFSSYDQLYKYINEKFFHLVKEHYGAKIRALGLTLGNFFKDVEGVETGNTGPPELRIGNTNTYITGIKLFYFSRLHNKTLMYLDIPGTYVIPHSLLKVLIGIDNIDLSKFNVSRGSAAIQDSRTDTNAMDFVTSHTGTTLGNSMVQFKGLDYATFLAPSTCWVYLDIIGDVISGNANTSLLRIINTGPTVFIPKKNAKELVTIFPEPLVYVPVKKK